MASDRGRVVALRLWWASWKQNPAGSLPAADYALCQLAGCGDVLDAWLAVKGEALRGWVKCSDGRLYHPVVCEQAEIAYKYRQRATASASGETARKHREREERRALFAKLRDAGYVLNFNTPMKILREQAARIVTAPVTASSAAQRDTVASMPNSPAIMPHDSPGEAPVTAPSTAYGEHVTAYEKTVTGRVTSNTGPDLIHMNPSDSYVVAHPTPQRNRSNRGTRLPDDWCPSSADQEFAGGLGLDVEWVAHKFRDHWHGQSGQRGVKADWSATWRNWCRNEKPSNSSPVRKDTRPEQVRQIDELFGSGPSATAPPPIAESRILEFPF